MHTRHGTQERTRQLGEGAGQKRELAAVLQIDVLHARQPRKAGACRLRVDCVQRERAWESARSDHCEQR